MVRKPNEDIEDRIFVCIGRHKLKHGKVKEQAKKAYWVMTLDDTYKEVTFWDVIHPKQVVLK